MGGGATGALPAYLLTSAAHSKLFVEIFLGLSAYFGTVAHYKVVFWLIRRNS